MNRPLLQNSRLLRALLLVHGIAAGVYGQKPGTLLWKFHHPVATSPAIGTDGTVYIGSFGGWVSTATHKGIFNWKRSSLPKSGSSIFALDGKTGKKKWVFNLGEGEGLTPAIGSDGTVYVGPSNESVFYALNGKTGAKKWEFKWNRGSRNRSMAPAIGDDGTVYIGTSFTVYALDGKTGSNKWEFIPGHDARNTLAIGIDGTVYIGADKPNKKNKFYAVNGITGKKRWEFPSTTLNPTLPTAYSSPAIGYDGTVYFGSMDYNQDGNYLFYAVDSKTGKKKWEFGSQYAANAFPPAIGTDGTVYVVTNKFAYALNGKTGRKKWQLKGTYFSPAIASNETIYFGSNVNKLHAVNARTGVRKWEFETEGWLTSSPAIGANGTVYFGSWDGAFYAVHGSAGPADSAWPMFGQNAERTGREVTAPRVSIADPELNLHISRVLSDQGQITIQAVGKPSNILGMVELEFSNDLIHWRTQNFQLPINLPLNFPLTQDAQFMRVKRIKD